MDEKYNNKGYLPAPVGFSTIAIHAGQDPEKWDSWQVVPPISLSTTFKQKGPAQPVTYEYARSGNPTRDTLEAALAALDGASHGLCFSSGLGATTAIVHLLKAGDHILSCDDVYGGTNRYFSKCASNFGIDVSFVDLTDAAVVKANIKENTKLIWIESPTNPLLKVIDIKAVVAIARSHPDVVVVVDNTFLTSYYQRPLELGADITVYSCTKYINGHSDVVMGAITLNRDDLYKQLAFYQNAAGIVPSPFDCYLVNRSLKTLALRMREHMKNGLVVAKFLENHSKVEKVYHPGLPSHPQYLVALNQCSGVSGMVSFVLKGTLTEASNFLKALKVFTLAESLGGYESLAELPVSMTHASVPENQRLQLGISDSLIRLSVGLEDVEDLVKDLEQALSK